MKKVITQTVAILILNFVYGQSPSYHSYCAEKEDNLEIENCTKETIKFILQKAIQENYPQITSY